MQLTGDPETELPKRVRKVAVKVRKQSQNFVEKFKTYTRNFNESTTVIASIWTSGCGLGIITVIV